MAEAARQEDWPRTVEEFEVWHARQPERWEFMRRQPRMMAPAASINHSIIKRKVTVGLHACTCTRVPATSGASAF